MRARAAVDAARAEANVTAAWRRLQALWAEPAEGEVPSTSADPLKLPDIPDYATLRTLLEHNPQLRGFANEARIREARLRLADSASKPDIDWQLGVRRLEADDSWEWLPACRCHLAPAIVRKRRPAPARAELDSLAFERESGERRLDSLLAEAHGQFTAARIEVERTAEDVLPRLGRAETAAEQAYRAGALSYLDWALLQRETTAARRQQLAAAVSAHRALIEIQRLTGEALVTSTGSTQDSVP